MSSPAVSDGKVYIGSKDGNVYCFKDSGVNNPPYVPRYPMPFDGTSYPVFWIPDLFWTGGDPDPEDTVTYDIYLGPTNPPQKIISNHSNTTCHPGTMIFNTTYYWQIVAWDNHGAMNSGPIWNFTNTNHPPNIPNNPNPYDGEINADIAPDLSWTGGDLDNTPVMYDVYFGTNNPPLNVVSNQSETIYDPGKLNGNTTYYWQIVSWDELGASSSGPIWDFTTADVVDKVYVDDD